MKKLYAAAILCFLLFASLFFISVVNVSVQKKESTDVFVGIDVAYADLDEIKALVEEVSPYTNLFIIGSEGISLDTLKLDEMCQYLTAKDMQFIIYTDDPFRLELIIDVAKNYEDYF
ncbi:MAG: hypothetical protein P8X84_02655, partial [Candidatus Bathyarchaeota archaeon]